MKSGEIDGFQTNGHVIGSGNSKTKINRTKANHHDGVIIGGSITKGRSTVAKKSIDKLPNERTDGRIL